MNQDPNKTSSLETLDGPGLINSSFLVLYENLLPIWGFAALISLIQIVAMLATPLFGRFLFIIADHLLIFFLQP